MECKITVPIPELGKLCDNTARRDCVHIAVAPVMAAEEMNPGDRIGIDPVSGQATFNSEPVGIVDPYLTKTVQTGQWFWLCLLPGTVTSIRHQWQHPAFRPKVPERKT